MGHGAGRRTKAQWLRLVALYTGLAGLVWLSEPTRASVALGVPLLVAGEWIRVWASGHLIKTDALITSGPYAYVRNPLYLGRLCIFVGLALICRLPYSLHLFVLALGLVVFFFDYLPRKERVEPARLRERHAERFTRYFSEVPALWPRMTRWPEAESDPWSARRFARNREIWTLLALATLGAIQLTRALT